MPEFRRNGYKCEFPACVRPDYEGAPRNCTGPEPTEYRNFVQVPTDRRIARKDGKPPEMVYEAMPRCPMAIVPRWTKEAILAGDQWAMGLLPIEPTAQLADVILIAREFRQWRNQ